MVSGTIYFLKNREYSQALMNCHGEQGLLVVKRGSKRIQGPAQKGGQAPFGNGAKPRGRAYRHTPLHRMKNPSPLYLDVVS